MNYLAHLLLAQDNPLSRLGNLMGDFKGDRSKLPDAVLLGIENHKAVDKFTDNHSLITQLKPLFSRQRRRFSGIILDVLFDHFLLKHWSNYCSEEPQIFIQSCYGDLASHQAMMPARMQHVVALMSRDNWLGAYEDLAGVGRALDGIASRIRFKNDYVGALEEVTFHYASLESAFLAFFPQLIEHVRVLSLEVNPSN